MGSTTEQPAVELDYTGPEYVQRSQKFKDQFGDEYNPKAVLQVLEKLHYVNERDMDLCFSLAYPTAKYCLDKLELRMLELYRIFRPRATSVPDLSYLARTWKGLFGDLFSVEPTYPEWSSNITNVREVVGLIHRAWAALQTHMAHIHDDCKYLDKTRRYMPAICDVLKEQIDALVAAEEIAEKTYAEAEMLKSQTPNPASSLQQPVQGINKTGSWSSALPAPQSSSRMRNRSPQKVPDINSYLDYNSTKRPRAPGWLGLSKARHKHKSWIEMLGHHHAAYLIVLFFSVSSASATGVAAWECSTSATEPVVDSNFWSTLSQSLTGVAGLYCIIIPLLRRDEIKARDPRLFNALLLISFSTALASVVLYPFQARASLILCFISGLAQLAATLQLVEDAGSTVTEKNIHISEKNETIYRQEGEIEFLERRLDERDR